MTNKEKMNKKDLISLKNVCEYFSSSFDYDEIELADMFAPKSYYLKIEDEFIPLKDLNIHDCWCDALWFDSRTDESMVYFCNSSETKINKLLCLNYDKEQGLFLKDDTFTLIYYAQEDKWKILYIDSWGRKIDIGAEEITNKISLVGGKTYTFSSYLRKLTPKTIFESNPTVSSNILQELQGHEKYMPKFIPYEDIFIVKDDVFEKKVKQVEETFNEQDKKFIFFIKQHCGMLRNALQGSLVAAIKKFFLDGEILFQLCAPLLATYSEERLKGAEEKKVKLINDKLENKFATKPTGLTLEEFAKFIKENIYDFPSPKELHYHKFSSNWITYHSKRNILLSELLTTVIRIIKTVNKTSKLSELKVELLEDLAKKYNCSKEKVLSHLLDKKVDLLFKINSDKLDIYPKDGKFISDRKRAARKISYSFPDPWNGNLGIEPRPNDKIHKEITYKLKKTAFYKLSTVDADGATPTHYLEELIKNSKVDRTEEGGSIYLEIPDEEDRDGVIRAYGYKVSLKDAKITLDDVRVSESGIAKLEVALLGTNEKNKDKIEQNETNDYVFKKKGDGWYIKFEEVRIDTVKNMVGLQYIDKLVHSPKKPFSADDLITMTRSTISEKTYTPEEGRQFLDELEDRENHNDTFDGGDLEMTDEKTIKEVRKELDTIKEAIKDLDNEISKENNDAFKTEELKGKKEKLVSEKTKLEKYLTSTTNKKGKSRKIGNQEKNRKSVKKAIDNALNAIKKRFNHNNQPYVHLKESIKTGRECCYMPKLKDISWE